MPVGAVGYFQVANDIIARLEATQMDALLKAAEFVTESISNGGMLFTFGTGHSYYLAGEAFARAGGLYPVQIIACSNLSMLDGSARSGRTEKTEGYVACILADYDIRPGDVVLVISNSGRNAAPIEACLYAHAKGAKVIAITNVAHSSHEAPRHSNGKRLMDIADVVLDNCGPHGDAAVELPGLTYKVGPVSTVMGAMLVNALVTQVASNLQERGIEPPVLVSGNVDIPDRERIYQNLARWPRPLKHR